ncbi:phosphotransferase [Streptomyces sp. NBC_01594]|uniref:phosphotransferase n=1 Tax=Streptomyces sp. NBC_01594 TaxID=2975890 RepID=UPI00386C4421
MGKMHADEADTDADLVRRLLPAQFPQWADLPITRLASGGTVNAIYRLGEDLTVRLPLRPGGAEAIAMEARLLPRLAPLLPLPIPDVVATGAPGEGYPLVWAVHRWIEGRNPVEGELAEPERAARDLAEFAVAIRKIDLPGGPAAHRGEPLIADDQAMRAVSIPSNRGDLLSLDPPSDSRPVDEQSRRGAC